MYLAPVFGRDCVDGGATCTWVVATAGEGGSCKLPGGCQPDLATVRAAELAASAAVFGATLIQLDLGDNGSWQPYAGDVGDVINLWAAKVGGQQALVELFEQIITDNPADVIYTMDPRHGGYCHPTHRAVGAMVALAALDLGEPAGRVHLLAGHKAAVGVGWEPMAPADPTLESYDATEQLASIGGEAWLYLLEVAKAHPSQFQLTDADIAAVVNAPDEVKRVYTVPLIGAETQNPLYDGVCAPSTF